MIKLKFGISILLFLFIEASVLAQDALLAFPGADGFGKFTSGGRGGKVYVVTNLNDDGEGSFRDAIKKKEPRIILFNVSGNIKLESPITIHQGNVTIAGQSAPGDGICIQNYPVKISADNVIVRFIRFRLGDEKAQEDDAFGGTNRNTNVIIDHCSMSWATDECASFYRNKNFTMQWCIISESLNHSVHTKGDHGYGGIWGGEKASFHHNLLANHTSRNPRFSGSSTTVNSPDELVDFRNNVIYNWRDNSTYGGEKGHYNMINNYYKPGTSTKPNKIWILNAWSPYGAFFLEGNCLEGNSKASINNWLSIKADNADSARASKPFTVEYDFNHSAIEAYKLVLEFSGASFKRDVVDERITQEAEKGISTSGKNRDGIIDSQRDVGGWPELKSTEAWIDTDADGMPDAWEKSNGLNSEDSSDGNKMTLDKTFSNVEVYLNSLVEKVVPTK